VLPMHGSRKEPGKGLVERIKRDLGLKQVRLKMLAYPVELVQDDGTVFVDFPDVPEAHTDGEDEAGALSRAVDAVETALSMYIEDRKPIPRPSRPKRGQKVVRLPALTEAKIALYETMRTTGAGKAELARRLSCHLPQVDRLLDLAHASKLEQLEAAFRSLGKTLTVQILDAA
jgi:antitoxin HicB